jgi:CheY-like chemotaxis protein
MKAILFVDDHEVLARLSCEILQMQGYRAEYCFNGPDALAKFDHDKFDMVITDYHMDGMNGVELAKQIRQRTPDVPVVIVTGFANIEECDAVSAWMEKQDLFPALLDKIKLLIGEGEIAETLNTETLKSA